MIVALRIGLAVSHISFSIKKGSSRIPRARRITHFDGRVDGFHDAEADDVIAVAEQKRDELQDALEGNV